MVYFIIRIGVNKVFLMKFYHFCVYSCNLKLHVSSGNQTIVACVLVVGSQYSYSFLQSNRIP